VRQLAWLMNRGPFPFGGDGNTVSQASTGPLRPAGGPGVIASLRMVVELKRWDETRFSMPGGQSGNPLSQHYDDLLSLWLKGDGVPIAWSEAAVEAATTSRLELRPL
jgi:penicillin amidase